jgi:hypothetical protein
MIEVANRKLLADSFATKVSFGILRNEDLGMLEGSFDGALSNFAGMNCSNDWPGIATRTRATGQAWRSCLALHHGPLRACGRCFTFCCAANLEKRFGAASRNHVARIGSNSVDVHYLSVRDAKRHSSQGFLLCGWRGVGVFVPPSYCEPLFKTHNGTCSGFLRSSIPGLDICPAYVALATMSCSIL